MIVYFLKIPKEIVLEIAKKLDNYSWVYLRICCKSLYNILQNDTIRKLDFQQLLFLKYLRFLKSKSITLYNIHECIREKTNNESLNMKEWMLFYSEVYNFCEEYPALKENNIENVIITSLCIEKNPNLEQRTTITKIFQPLLNDSKIQLYISNMGSLQSIIERIQEESLNIS